MEYGIIRPIEIAEEMRSAYLDYAMSVIVARALPDVRDGLKPVQRRIIYVMYQLGLQHNVPFKKSARIVGDTLGRYHPHGDAAVYEAMVRMAQDFTMRYPLVDGQGNFGSIDGDPPAAQRYTEARLTAIAEEILRDIEKETVDLVPNFDATLEEPLILPAAMPNLLLNGVSGIAVGMATNIPPHNLKEVCSALSLLIENPEATTEDLMRVLPGPDFPTGGIILGQEGIRTAYSTGKGHFVVRAKAHIEEATRGRSGIVVTELPYQVNKARLLERIAELVKQDRLSDISDLRDESDRSGMRIVITLKREAQPEVVLNQLFKLTQMQITFAVNLLALVDGTQPRLLTLKRMLQHYITHRQEVIVRRSTFELGRARQRAHILEGLRIALEHLDEVIETIRRSQSAETAKVNLMRRFKLTELQAQAILDLQLRRLAALERKKIEAEYQETLRRIAELEDILAHPKKVLELIRDELRELAARYGDNRRTRILPEESAEITAEDLIPEEEVLVMVSERGYVRRLSLEAYRRRKRGRSARTRETDVIRIAAVGNTRSEMLFFGERGRCYPLKVHRLPDAERETRGLPLSNFLPIEPQERIVGMVPVADYESPLFLVLLTRSGRVKQTVLGEFRGGRGNGLTALTLEEGDALVGVALAQGEEDVLITTVQGQALRFSLDEVRPMGRSAAGVKAISLGAGDQVGGMEVVRRPDAALLVISVDGYGKCVSLFEYPRHRRGGKGVVTIRTGRIATARLVEPQDEVLLASARGVVVHLSAGEIPLRGRAVRGNRLVELEAGDSVVGAVVIPSSVPSPPAPAPKEMQRIAPPRKQAAEAEAGELSTPRKRTQTPSRPAGKKPSARRRPAEGDSTPRKRATEAAKAVPSSRRRATKAPSRPAEAGEKTSCPQETVCRPDGETSARRKPTAGQPTRSPRGKSPQHFSAVEKPTVAETESPWIIRYMGQVIEAGEDLPNPPQARAGKPSPRSRRPQGMDSEPPAFTPAMGTPAPDKV